MKNLRPPSAPTSLTAKDQIASNGSRDDRALSLEKRTRVSAREAARLANCSLTTIYRLLRAGFISGSRLSPRKMLVEVESLRAHVQALQDPDFWTPERRSQYMGCS